MLAAEIHGKSPLQKLGSSVDGVPPDSHFPASLRGIHRDDSAHADL